jgi:hypothetical protein
MSGNRLLFTGLSNRARCSLDATLVWGSIARTGPEADIARSMVV